LAAGAHLQPRVRFRRLGMIDMAGWIGTSTRFGCAGSIRHLPAHWPSALLLVAGGAGAGNTADDPVPRNRSGSGGDRQRRRSRAQSLLGAGYGLRTFLQKSADCERLARAGPARVLCWNAVSTIDARMCTWPPMPTVGARGGSLAHRLGRDFQVRIGVTPQ
jgi:hypothetical protein